MQLTFITSNPNKAREVGQILGGSVAHQAVEVAEIQSLSLREVVENKVRAAFASVGTPVLVEDVSLEYGALGGFPGPFVKYWNSTAGNDLAARIAEMEKNDGMIARCGAAYFDGETLLYAEGVAQGKVVAKRGTGGFGFDPYFVLQGETRTFAEMSAEEKNAVSHRARAFVALRDMLAAAGKL